MTPLPSGTVEHNASSRIQLRDHQITPAQKLLEALETPTDDGKQCRVLGVAPVGFGKTVLFSWIAAQYAASGRKVLVLAHREELLRQIEEKMQAFGLSTGIEKAENRVDAADLPDVTIASVQTLKGARLARFDPEAYALIVVDESHHVVRGDAYCRVFDRFASASVLGVTGTPKRLDGKALGDVFKVNPVVIGLDEGIRSGWLVEPAIHTYRVKGYKLDTVRTIAGEYSASDIERELLLSPVLHATANIVEEVSAGRRTLVFSPTVKLARELAELLRARGLRALAVSGDMPRAERAESTRQFRTGEVDIAVNCMLWTEGFDVPETDCVVLLRPTKSSALMIQMIGRGLRLHPGKTGCVLVEIEPESVGRKLFATPGNVLEGAPGVHREDKGLHDEEGKVKEVAPDVTRVIASVDTDVAVTQRSYGDVMGYRPPLNVNAPSDSQLYAVKQLGFDPKKVLTKDDVQKCLDIVNDRRRRGLCSVKIGKMLQRYGFNGNVSDAVGREALDAITGNGWRPPQWMYRDPRFQKSRAA